MMRVAFHAPLKAPDHPTPSGDRKMARNLMAALERGLGAQVWLASGLRSREPEGDPAAQERLFEAARAELARRTPLRGDTAF
ncbi:MAG: glycosyltransferase family 1 protein, partial [Rhodobacteraceae bacterium]